MLSVTRFCRRAYTLPQSKVLIGNTSQNFIRNGVRTYMNPLWRRQSLTSNLKIKNIFRGSGTVAVRLASDSSSKGKKAVGYWLLTCSGMVFVAVVLGLAFYKMVLVSICLVLEEVLKKTVK